MKIGYGQSHGKIILIGEHAVVYGYEAIAIPFFKTYCKVNIRESNLDYIKSNYFSFRTDNLPSKFEPIKVIINELKNRLNLPNLFIEIDSNIPIFSGMGSSAAVASSIVKAAYDFKGIKLSNEECFELTQISEKIAHGNPSGIDALTTANNSAWLFKKSSQPISFDTKIKGFLVVGQTGETGNTKEAVSIVRELVANQEYYELIDEIGKEVIVAYNAYINKDIYTLGNSLNYAQDRLKKLKVSSPNIDAMVTIANDNGALGAKLSGGGLGGIVIAITDELEKAKKISKLWIDFNNIENWILDLSEDLL